MSQLRTEAAPERVQVPLIGSEQQTSVDGLHVKGPTTFNTRTKASPEPATKSGTWRMVFAGSSTATSATAKGYYAKVIE